MAVSKEEILERIANMTVLEVVELVEAMEQKFGVSAAAAVGAVAMAPSAEVTETVEEKTEFDVILAGYGENKVAVIKAVRAITALGLKEAKDLVEGVPSPVKEGISNEEAEDIKKRLEEAGATVQIK